VVEKVVVQLVLDTSKYSSKARSAARETSKIDGAVGKTDKRLGGLNTALGKVGLAFGAAFAAKKVLDFATSSIAAFSNLEESINAIEVSYGDAADGVLELGENSAEQFGLSTRAVNEAAVAMSAFASKIDAADPPGAFENVLQRATDFASVMNLDVEEALVLFRSGLAGESEPLRKFGIDVSAATITAVGLAAGLGGVNGKLDEGEKVQARYLAIMEQTEKTAGDFANTSEGLANRQRILSAQWEEMQATIGRELEPAMTKLLGVGTKLIPIMGRLGIVIAGSLERFEPLIDLVGLFADQFEEAGESVEETSRRNQLGLGRVNDEFDKFFTFISQSLPQQAAAIVGFFGDSADAAADLQAAWDNVDPSAFDGDLAALGTTVRENLSGSLITAAAATGAFDGDLKQIGVTARDVAKAFGTQAASIRDVARAQAEAASPLLRVLRAQEDVVMAQERLVEVQGDGEVTALDLRDAQLDLIESQLGLESAAATASEVLDEGAAALLGVGTEAGLTTNAILELLDALNDLPTSLDIDLRFRGALPTASFLRGFGPREHGGPVTRGEPVLVGERGPEIFFPNSPGVISPNAAGGTINVTVNQPQTLDLATDLAAGLIAANVTRQVEAIR